MGRRKDLIPRTKNFAAQISCLFSELPKTVPIQHFGRQMLRSGTSVGSHYREGIRARSDAEYAAKLNAGLMELEETMYWLEMIETSGPDCVHSIATLREEASELTAIFVTLINKARRNPMF